MYFRIFGNDFVTRDLLLKELGLEYYHESSLMKIKKMLNFKLLLVSIR